MPDELLNMHPNVLGDLAQDDRGNIARTMNGNCCSPPINMTVLTVRSPLTDKNES